MYKKTFASKTSLERNEAYIGESIEEKIERIVNNKEPITDGAPLLFTERKEGVRADTNIRTDRFELAVDAMDKVQKSHVSKREERMKGIKGGKADGDDKGKDAGGESTQATDSK